MMEAYTFPLRVKLPECIKKSEFLGCNLNPVVVLTDFRKSLKEPLLGSRAGVAKNFQSEGSGSDSILREGRPVKKSKGPKAKSHFSAAAVAPARSSPSSTLSNPKRFKSMKRKRESWDPSVEYEIEKIVGYHRDKRNKMWYLVKWKNWSDDHNTFEPIGNLTGCHYELMKYFETTQPTDGDIYEKSIELEEGLKKRVIYSKLLQGGCKAEHLEEFSRECPDAVQLLQAEDLDELENRIRQEYGYIVRCLIGMYSHQDQRLVVRGQNYKLLMKLIQLRREQLRTNAAYEDLINRREKVRVVIENRVDLEEFPSLNYIVDLKPGKGVVLPKEPLLGCECPEGCSLKSRCCGQMADSRFAYNLSGRLRTSERIAIYECNSRCRCPETCPNRVVQRGRQVSLCIFKTRGCGWGVKTLERIAKGTFVCEYVGELIPDSEAVARDVDYFRENRSGYLFDLDFFADANLEMYCIDATKHGNLARFINHSCDPNLVVYPVWIDGLEPNLHRLAFFARRNIQKGEEIQFDYENLEEMAESRSEDGKVGHGLRMLSNVRCQCNAANCREWVFGNK